MSPFVYKLTNDNSLEQSKSYQGSISCRDNQWWFFSVQLQKAVSIWDEIIQIPIQSMKLSFAPDKIETLLYSLAIMAPPGGHFSRPSGMGGYVVELHIQDDTFF